MLSPRNAQIIAVLLTLSFLLATPFQAARAQTGASKQQDPPPPAGVKPAVDKQKPEAEKQKSDQKPDYSQEAVVIEQLSTAYRYESDGRGQRELTMRIKIQSDAGVERFGQLVFPYSSANEKLEMDYVRVRKPDGSVVSATNADIQDLSAPLAREAPVYTDLRQKHITVPGLRPGDELEYRFVWDMHSPLAQDHFWVEHDFVTRGPIVLTDELTVNIPAASKVKLKTEPGYDATIKEENGRRIYSWKKAKLTRDADEDEKAREKAEAADEEEAEEKDPEEIRPHVQLTTFQSWAEVGQWYAALQRDRVVPDEKIKIKAEEIIKGRTTEKEKITALYEYVAKNFRYVSLSLGQGRYQPHAAPDVMSNQYGDCKDKHTLLASMLAATGRRAYPVLINSSRKLDVDIPSPGQFDHVISAIPIGEETLWADTTSEIAPAGLLSPRLRNKKALMVPISGPARLETTPAEPPFLSSEMVTMEGTVDDLGKVTARGKLVLHGDSEMYMRYMFRRTPKSDWKNLGFYLGMAGGLSGEVTDIKATDPANLETPFEVEFNVSRKDFLDWSTKKLKVPLPFPPFSLNNFYGRTSKSKKPLEIGPPIDVSYSLKLTIPAKYQTRLPLPLKVARDYGEYAANYKLEGQTLVAERTLRMRQRELPAERLQDYQAFVAAVRSDAGQTLSLETEIAGTPAIPESVKTEDLIQASDAALRNGNFPIAEQLLKRVVEKEPKHKTVRRNLSFVLVQQRKFDEAIAVLRDQTKINPFEDYAYNMLGRVYWYQQDYANAEESFRKQLEVSPLDQTAHSNLGQLYVDWRKYKEAIPALERAISLAPEQEILHVSIGRAYLALGEAPKAIAAFEEALKLSRTPLVLNNVAYYLAVEGAQLDKAQQYAESAVTTVATSLRNLETGNLTLEDLQAVASLAAYWDTLGWVFFQKGDLDNAEKYIKASWAIQQHSEVGHHIGSVAEKRGKKDDAIRLYAQGAVADHVRPEARESLLKLVKADTVEALLQTAKKDLPSYQTLTLAQLLPEVKAPVEAEFYLLLAPDASRNAQVVDVKFIKGEDSLKPLASQLKSIKYPLVFPDASPTKIVRRGTLRCVAKPGACTFTMVSPDLILSVD
jgi:tetratricopeptide (TPR) repeat protein